MFIIENCYNYKVVVSDEELKNELLCNMEDEKILINWFNFKNGMIYYNGNCEEYSEMNIDKMDIKLLGWIARKYRYGKYNKEAIEKIVDIGSYLGKYFCGRKVEFNGEVGTIRKINDDEYGFFKPRVRKYYKVFDLSRMASIKLI